MSLNILLLLLNIGTSGLIRSNIELVENQTVVELIYDFPGESVERVISYRLVGQEKWNRLPVNDTNGSKKLNTLQPDKLYVAKLTWQDATGLEKESSGEYFRTFKELDLSPADYENHKIINTTYEKGHEVHDLFQGQVSFRYQDQYLRNGILKGEIYDAESFLVSRFYLNKNKDGIYHINLLDIQYSWQEDEIYVIRLHDDINTSKWLNVRFKNLDGQLSLSIDLTALNVNCEIHEPSVIQFNGIVDGGSMPYEIVWSVRSVAGEQIIYGPTTPNFVRNEEIPTITLELQLPYLITLSVFDGCGLFEETSLQITCSEDERNNNAILFERIGLPDETSN